MDRQCLKQGRLKPEIKEVLGIAAKCSEPQPWIAEIWNFPALSR